MSWLGSLANDFAVKHPHAKMPSPISRGRKRLEIRREGESRRRSFWDPALCSQHPASCPLTFIMAWRRRQCCCHLYTEDESEAETEGTLPRPHELDRSHLCGCLFFLLDSVDVLRDSVSVSGQASRKPGAHFLPSGCEDGHWLEGLPLAHVPLLSCHLLRYYFPHL